MATKPGGAYIDDLPDDGEGRGYYELDSTVDEYLAFHFPASDPLTEILGERTPPLAERFPFALAGLWDAAPDGCALDVGCAVGVVTQRLAADHRLALGLDLSHALVRGATHVGRTGRATYRTVVEGNLRQSHDVRVPTDPSARFLVGDALSLPFADGAFATVVASNLVDRVPDPVRALDELARVLRPGGVLLLSSPYTWLATFTAPERWLGGRPGETAIRGYDRVRIHLAPACELEEETRLPFYIPHHTRSGQLGVAHVQKFRRRTK